MGIRFYCPNGHKLNVKEFQAGRRGICPYCGTKIQIPTSSTRRSARDDDADATDEPVTALTGGMPATMAAPVRATTTNWPTATPGAPSAFGPAPTAANGMSGSGPTGAFSAAPAGPIGSLGPMASQNLAAAPVAASAFAGGFAAPMAPTAPTFTPTPADPLAEAGEVVWYVRPAAGGQFGPASADVMRNWLGEGRVPADALVWREGWRDWQLAGDVFPALRGPQLPAANLPPTPTPVAAFVPVVSPIAGTPESPKSKQKQIIIIAALAFAVLVLGILLLVVLLNSGGSEPAETPSATVSSDGMGTCTLPSPPAELARSFRPEPDDSGSLATRCRVQAHFLLG